MKVENWKIERVKPYEKNPRKNEQAVDAVAESLEKFGFRQPLVVDKDGVLIVGHTRLKAAIKLGLKEVPVHVADLDDVSAKAYRLVDNQTANLAEWDFSALSLELKELKDLDFDMSGFKFDSNILSGEPVGGQTDPDDVPEPPKVAKTKIGDLYILGNHRLLCGDSTNADDVERLMDGQKSEMVFTDPPWNVAIGKDSNPRHRQREGLINDCLPKEEFQLFLNEFSFLMSKYNNGDVYCVLGASEWPTLDSCLREIGYHWSATIIWVKDQFVLGRSKYHRRYEPIWYGWHKNGNSSFCDKRNLDDVWEIARPKRSDEHPTMKPIELPVKAIENSSSIGGLVYEPFCGSGTTLIACEKTGRKCYGMELDPIYCDVIVKRWEEFTGKKAVLLSEVACG